jgi:predicted nucleic acid-binding protein
MATADQAIEVAERHRLRAYDCLQLATALLLQEQRVPFELSPLVLVSSDAELNAAAEGEGLNVEDPAG